MVWSYFGSGHNKGVHDGVKALLKQEIEKEQLDMDGRRFLCVVDVVPFCEKRQMEEHLAYLNAR
jgi:hypothetical protein